MRQIFLDTETTGLSPENGDRIVEIGCIEMVNRRLTHNNKHFYLNPQRPNSPDAVKIHGLTDDFLADKPLFASVAQELIEYLRGADLIIHNAAFDVAFLDAEFERIKAKNTTSVAARVTDTLAMAREMFPGKSNSLDALCKRLGVDNSGRTLHGALLDAGLLADVYIAMTRGQDSLVIDAHPETQQAGASLQAAAAKVHFKALDLPVIEPSEEERAAHADWLAHLDKASGGRRVWPDALA